VKVGIPCELKSQEYRVAITPSGVNELVRGGHRVYVERGAGKGSSIPDADFVAAGAEILQAADDVWATGELILKVKEPIPEEYGRMRKDQVFCTLPPPKNAPTRCWPRGRRRLRTRPCNSRIGLCRCWRPCRKLPDGWPRKSGPTTS
jgi:hypothetical protein